MSKTADLNDFLIRRTAVMSDPEACKKSSVLPHLAQGTFGTIVDREAHGIVETLEKAEGIELEPHFLDAHDVFEQNRELCAAFVRRARDGDDDARQEYEQRRLCAFDRAPTYAQEETRKICCHELKNLLSKPSITLNEWAERISGRLLKQPPLLPSFIGIRGVLTYEMGTKILNPLRELPRSPVLPPTPKTPRSIPDKFNPASRGPLGAAALTAFAESLSLLLKSAILEDTLSDLSRSTEFRDAHTNPTFNPVKLQTVRAATSPWDILQSPLVENFCALVELTEASVLSPRTVERVLNKPTFFLQPPDEFGKIVADMNATLSQKELNKQAAAHHSAGTFLSGAKPALDQINLTERQRFFRALEGAKPNGMGFSDFCREYRELYAAFKKGRVTQVDCLDLVREGKREAPLLPGKLDWTASVVTPCLPQTEAPPLNQQEIPEAETYEIMGCDSKWFEKWLSKLSVEDQKQIETRLEKARMGIFTDKNQLVRDHRLFEFRFHRGAGNRIFFAFTDESTITLLAAGSKQEQERLIDTAIRRLESGEE